MQNYRARLRDSASLRVMLRGVGAVMRIIKVLLISFLFCGTLQAQPLPPQEFTARFGAALQKQVPGSKVVTKDALTISIGLKDGQSADLSLDRVYQSYRADPARFDVLVGLFAKALVQADQKAKTTLDRTRIVPVIRTSAWLSKLRETLRPQGMEPLFAPFSGELAVVYAEDGTGGMRYLTSRDDVGERAALHRLALENLQRVLPKIEVRPGRDGLLVVSAGGNYESSLLLFEDIWSGGQFEVAGDIVVGVPARDVLLVTGSRNRKGLKAMRAVAEEFARGEHALSAGLLVYRKGKFSKFGRD